MSSREALIRASNALEDVAQEMRRRGQQLSEVSRTQGEQAEEAARYAALGLERLAEFRQYGDLDEVQARLRQARDLWEETYGASDRTLEDIENAVQVMRQIEWEQSEESHAAAALLEELAGMTRRASGGELPESPEELLVRAGQITQELEELVAQSAYPAGLNALMADVSAQVNELTRLLDTSPAVDIVDEAVTEQEAPDEPTPDRDPTPESVPAVGDDPRRITIGRQVAPTPDRGPTPESGPAVGNGARRITVGRQFAYAPEELLAARLRYTARGLGEHASLLPYRERGSVRALAAAYLEVASAIDAGRDADMDALAAQTAGLRELWQALEGDTSQVVENARLIMGMLERFPTEKGLAPTARRPGHGR